MTKALSSELAIGFRVIRELPVVDPIKYYNALGRDRKRAWAKDNPEKVRESLRAYVERNSDKVRESKRISEKNNPETVKRKEKRRNDRNYHRPFVAIDAEGMTIPGHDIVVPHKEPLVDGSVAIRETVYPEHRTILWGAQGWRRTYSSTELDDNPASPRTDGAETEAQWLGHDDKRPLPSLEILDWLTSLPGKFGPDQGFPDGVNFVGFGFSYDANQLFKDLPYEKVWEITRKRSFKTKRKFKAPVLFDTYMIDYLKGKHLKIWKLRDRDNPYHWVIDKNGNPKREPDSIARIEIEDTFGFYQSAFVHATESLIGQGYLAKEDHDTITKNKKERPNFDTIPFPQIKHYCHLELVALSKALTVLRDGFDRMDIHLRDWTGAGSAAGALIRKQELKDRHYSPDIAAKNPSPQQMQAHHAFFGGRIELLKQGYAAEKDLWQYDIASAYPSAMLELPSMRDGRWVKHGTLTDILNTSQRSNILSMFRVKWSFPEKSGNLHRIPFYPLPYRTRKRGAILFPSKGHAWIMRDEIVEACVWVETFFPGRSVTEFLTIEEWTEFIPGNDEKPYAFVAELYKMRREAKDARVYDIVEKAIKLAINSLYGKTAQTVGGEKGEPPKCVCPYYAAAITTNCRARLMQAALLAPYSIVSFMTDGIISTRELKELPRAKDSRRKDIELGDWEFDKKTGGFFFMSGWYTFFGGNGKTKPRTRGINPNKFVLRMSVEEFFTEHVLSGWRKPGEDEASQFIHFKLNTYVTAGAACASRDRFKLIGRWADVERQINIHSPGAKRTFDGLHFSHVLSGEAYNGKLDMRLVRTLANEVSALPRDVLACIRSGESLRCRFLIPTTPAINPTPEQLSAPSKPEWLNPGDDRNDEDDTLLNNNELETAEICLGMA